MKKQKTILVALVALAVAASLVVASVLLVRGGRGLVEAQEELKARTDEYQAYFNKNPFPARENVAVERGNRETLDIWFRDILAAVTHPPMAAERSPSTFVRLLTEKRDSLVETARKCHVRDIPPQDRFSLSFERYLGGSMLPAPDDVPTLTQQLLIVDGLCKLLFEAGVLSLVSVTRDEFESAAKGPGPAEAAAEPARIIRGVGYSAGAGRTGDGNRAVPIVNHPLYTRMTFGFKFTATEDVLWEVLNALAKHGIFTVVSLISVEKTGSDIRALQPETDLPQARTGGEEAAAASLKTLPRSQRQASGTEMQAPLSVAVEVQTYLFKSE